MIQMGLECICPPAPAPYDDHCPAHPECPDCEGEGSVWPDCTTFGWDRACGGPVVCATCGGEGVVDLREKEQK